MTRLTFAPAFAVVAALSLAACDRTPSQGAESARDTGTTVQPPTASASTPMPVSPSGTTNSSTAARGADLTNSTRASGDSNVYQPPSSDNPPPGGGAATAGSAATGATSSTGSGTGQSTTSETRGTSVPPNDGTLPGGTTGTSGSRRGGGKG
jgi:hypothetical protein